MRKTSANGAKKPLKIFDGLYFNNEPAFINGRLPLAGAPGGARQEGIVFAGSEEATPAAAAAPAPASRVQALHWKPC